MTNDWIARQWENADFGDSRLNNRAVLMANLMMKQPGASLPDQMGSSATIKGAYRFLSNRLVSHEVLQKDHYQLVLEQTQQSYRTVRNSCSMGIRQRLALGQQPMLAAMDA